MIFKAHSTRLVLISKACTHKRVNEWGVLVKFSTPDIVSDDTDPSTNYGLRLVNWKSCYEISTKYIVFSSFKIKVATLLEKTQPLFPKQIGFSRLFRSNKDTLF